MVRSLTLNYLDDLAGVEDDKADTAFQKMGQLLSDLGLKGSADKASSPATIFTYLGVTFDSIAMRKTVPPEKVAELLDLLHNWATKISCTKRGLKSHCVAS